MLLRPLWFIPSYPHHSWKYKETSQHSALSCMQYASPTSPAYLRCVCSPLWFIQWLPQLAPDCRAGTACALRGPLESWRQTYNRQEGVSASSQLGISLHFPLPVSSDCRAKQQHVEVDGAQWSSYERLPAGSSRSLLWLQRPQDERLGLLGRVGWFWIFLFIHNILDICITLKIFLA